MIVGPWEFGVYQYYRPLQYWLLNTERSSAISCDEEQVNKLLQSLSCHSKKKCTGFTNAASVTHTTVPALFAHLFQYLRPRLERRKIVWKVEDSVPEERNCVRAFETKELSKTFPEERWQGVYFWRKKKNAVRPLGKLSCNARALTKLVAAFFLYFGFLHSKHPF